MTATAVSSADRLAGRYDPELFTPMRPDARVRLIGAGDEGATCDVVFTADRAFVVEVHGGADAELTADPESWESVAGDLRGGLDAFHAGRLIIRRDLHLGVGFLAATADLPDPESAGLRFAEIRTAAGTLSINEAGEGPPVVMLHGLGATKVSLLPTVAALAGTHRAIAVDLPGFGDSDKPILGAYDAPFFARAVVALLDALGIERADFVGNSMGGRVALELGLSFPERVRRLCLLAPSLAWLRGRPWVPLLRLVDPRLGLVQPAPRPMVEAMVRHVIRTPSGDEQWTAAGIDEFLRSFLTPRGRAAFYAAARNIYLEQPYGRKGLWTRLPDLRAPSLFVWGRQDRLVPLGFEHHVAQSLPAADHLELDCGHVPQLEAPRETHEALLAFLAG